MELIHKSPARSFVLGSGLSLTIRNQGILGVSDQILINGAVCGSLGYLVLIRTNVVDDAGTSTHEDGFFVIYNSMHLKVTRSLDARIVLARCRAVAGRCLEMEMERYHQRVGVAVEAAENGFVNVLMHR